MSGASSRCFVLRGFAVTRASSSFVVRMRWWRSAHTGCRPSPSPPAVSTSSRAMSSPSFDSRSRAPLRVLLLLGFFLGAPVVTSSEAHPPASAVRRCLCCRIVDALPDLRGLTACSSTSGMHALAGPCRGTYGAGPVSQQESPPRAASSSSQNLSRSFHTQTRTLRLANRRAPSGQRATHGQTETRRATTYTT